MDQRVAQGDKTTMRQVNAKPDSSDSMVHGITPVSPPDWGGMEGILAAVLVNAKSLAHIITGRALRSHPSAYDASDKDA